jgi:hypothetical protein
MLNISAGTLGGAAVEKVFLQLAQVLDILRNAS